MTKIHKHSNPTIKGKVSKEEWENRVNLAALYRLASHFQWTDLIFTHITCRATQHEEHFLINPYGVYFHEITASSLIKIDRDSRILSETTYEVNPPGFIIHSAIHSNRLDAKWVMHLHTLDGSAVAAQKEGLLPISQAALVIYEDLAYHDYNGIALAKEEGQQIIADLGQKNLMILNNHGTLTIGKTAAQAFLRMYSLERACSIQVRALTGGHQVNQADKELQKFAGEQSKAIFERNPQLAWPGLLRLLESLDSSFKE